MKPYEKQELAACGFFSKIFSKPAENGWKEVNNLLAAAPDMDSVTEDEVTDALRKWGVKFGDANLDKRSAIYRAFADRVFGEIARADAPELAQLARLGKLLALPPHLAKQAERGAKTAAYFARSKKLLDGEEALDIHALDALFGYDYEDGLSARKQVFQAHFNELFERIVKEERYSPAQEEHFRACCAKLDIPYEFKQNIVNSLQKYRNLWDAENKRLEALELDLPLEKGELCYATVNCGLCQNKEVEREDNLFELTRKFSIDETVSFKNEKLEHPKIKEEITALLELGHFFLTNMRLIYLSQKNAMAVRIDDIAGAEFDKINLVTFHRADGSDILIKFPDEAAEVMFILFKRVKKKEI